MFKQHLFDLKSKPSSSIWIGVWLLEMLGKVECFWFHLISRHIRLLIPALRPRTIEP